MHCVGAVAIGRDVSLSLSLSLFDAHGAANWRPTRNGWPAVFVDCVLSGPLAVRVRRSTPTRAKKKKKAQNPQNPVPHNKQRPRPPSVCVGWVSFFFLSSSVLTEFSFEKKNKSVSDVGRTRVAIRNLWFPVFFFAFYRTTWWTNWKLFFCSSFFPFAVGFFMTVSFFIDDDVLCLFLDSPSFACFCPMNEMNSSVSSRLCWPWKKLKKKFFRVKNTFRFVIYPIMGHIPQFRSATGMMVKKKRKKWVCVDLEKKTVEKNVFFSHEEYLPFRHIPHNGSYSLLHAIYPIMGHIPQFRSATGMMVKKKRISMDPWTEIDRRLWSTT